MNDNQEIQEMPMPPELDWKESCFHVRGDIEAVKCGIIQLLREHLRECPVGEAAANITLAYRHLEDARMRIGKAVQALDGGESCYPR